ncbi:MAG: DEAD/DEAH box helicase, partial [Chloroflexia bacterium]
MDVEEVLEALQNDPEVAPHITAWRTWEARPARYAPTPEWLDRRLREALAELGIAHLYTHQVEALEAAARGEHVVVATGTASGKSLCYHLPVLQALLEHPGAAALYLYPTKALAHDQEAFLRTLAGRTALPPFGTYDGDTPPALRPRLRREARLLLTNPDMLHAGILPRHPHWAPFLAALRYVILDELHVYRGLFGSHVANVLRRLKRICAFYGSRPRFLVASATIGNPGELAGRLLEEAVTVVEDDGAPRGRQHFLLYNPPLADPALGIRRSLLLEAENLAARFLEAGLPMVVFARTRLGMELLLTDLRERCGGRRGRLRGYRGGYRAEVRREIESGLRRGTVQGVVATNALELGVDIGTLSACILAGYPGTIAA